MKDRHLERIWAEIDELNAETAKQREWNRWLNLLYGFITFFLLYLAWFHAPFN